MPKDTCQTQVTNLEIRLINLRQQPFKKIKIRKESKEITQTIYVVWEPILYSHGEIKKKFTIK